MAALFFHLLFDSKVVFWVLIIGSELLQNSNFHELETLSYAGPKPKTL